MKVLNRKWLIFLLIACVMVLTSCLPIQRMRSSQVRSSQVKESSSVNHLDVKSSVKSGKDEKDTDVTEQLSDSIDQGLNSAKGKSKVSVDEQVLLDRNGVKVVLKDFIPEGDYGPTLKILVENNSNEAVSVRTLSVVVNGVMQDAYFYCDVPKGKKVNDELEIDQRDLDIAGIEVIKDIELRFEVHNTDTWDTYFESDPIVITTTADPSYVQKYDDSGFVAVDQNGIKIVMKKVQVENSDNGADIYVYIENNSSQNITVQVKEMSINGYMIDPIFSCDVLAGKKAYDIITFLENELEKNDISSIDEIELSFDIFDTLTFETILESDAVVINFK